ncbi:hypothetical protein [Actinomadura miaoliensis]|uniref:Uncharacterized protein n=1 Tax=Actinomadura miaoliensis TaxID=430685 RepID=A0ABP7WJE4_9ACTN
MGRQRKPSVEAQGIKIKGVKTTPVTLPDGREVGGIETEDLEIPNRRIRERR